MTLKISACVLSLVTKKKPDVQDQAKCSIGEGPNEPFNISRNSREGELDE